jgi:hypothetical protein
MFFGVKFRPNELKIQPVIAKATMILNYQWGHLAWSNPLTDELNWQTRNNTMHNTLKAAGIRK